MSKKPYTSLTFEKRQIIENMAKKKQTPQRIAEATGVHVATIYREMKRGQTKDGYRMGKQLSRWVGATPCQPNEHALDWQGHKVTPPVDETTGGRG